MEKCPACDKEITDTNLYLGYCVDPFTEEIHNEVAYREFCTYCYEQTALDI